MAPTDNETTAAALRVHNEVEGDTFSVQRCVKRFTNAAGLEVVVLQLVRANGSAKPTEKMAAFQILVLCTIILYFFCRHHCVAIACLPICTEEDAFFLRRIPVCGAFGRGPVGNLLMPSQQLRSVR